jgi:hypothetical protein
MNRGKYTSASRVANFSSTSILIITPYIFMDAITSSCTTRINGTFIVIIAINIIIDAIPRIFVTRIFCAEIVIVTNYSRIITSNEGTTIVMSTFIIIITCDRVMFTSTVSSQITGSLTHLPSEQ